ncbi:MAG: transposase, partial [Deltaproteobacteria bacterium]|nr:transposase [Deltaproteobacteria bacterium]
SLGLNFLNFMTSARYRTGGSFENLSRMIDDISEVKPSQTALNRALSKVSDSLESVADEIATEVMNSDYVNIDETGHKLVLEGKRSREGSKKIWVWVFGTPKAAYYHVDMTRSQDAIKTALEYRDPDKPPPISVTDAYPAYLNMFETKQFCWAHLLRDSKEVEDTCLAGKILHDKLVEMFQKIKSMQKILQEKNESASEKVYNKALKEINEIAEATSCKNVEKIQKHLVRRAEHYLTCLRFPQVPMVNNHAEQLLKSVIVHRSNGKPLRSERAMRQYGILLTVLTTWKLRGMPIGATLRDWIGKQINQARLLD